MPLYLTSFPPSSSSPDILYPLLLLPHIIPLSQYLYSPVLFFTKPRRHYLNYVSKKQITLTILLYIRCVVVSEKLCSRRILNTRVLSSLGLQLLISLTFSVCFSLPRPHLPFCLRL